ncbi:hypothetical protein CORT_0A01800 [Candida orthopsilosis Co 90-125]|uniref:Uncharacterized protein n=1 Tax=Candida orthopsilosis (strain 90-125) TaxID=1136231 RepID=H8WVU7_CANO9|nr:hypothetical protein CORT_0A01800 [Candida orthopsilosis Co 90-125]CCG20571.1 hypothetical protein CORT_0A01800 [Candida orthopsilosis Co 90-125]
MSSFIIKWVANRLLKDNQWNRLGVEDPYYEYVPIQKKNGTKYKKITRRVPEGISQHDTSILETFKKKAYRYDYWFKLLGVQFGWASIVSVVPVVGTVIQTYWSLQLLALARKIQGGLPLDLQLLFLLNIVIDFGLGFIPIIGSLIEIGYKANSRNFLLLEKHLERVGKKNRGLISKDEVRPGFINDTVQPFVDEKVKPFVDETIKPGAIKAGDQILELLQRKPRSSSTSSSTSGVSAKVTSGSTTQTSNATVTTSSQPSSISDVKTKETDSTLVHHNIN